MPTPLKLTVYKGSELVEEHNYDRDIIKIGRLASAHLKLEDTKVSRIHAVIEAASDGQDYSLIDMGSTEGTILNGEKISKEKVRDGDEIRVGDYRIIVAFDEEEASALVVSEAPVPPPDPPPPSQDLWTASEEELATESQTQALSPESPLEQPAAAPIVTSLPEFDQPVAQPAQQPVAQPMAAQPQMPATPPQAQPVMGTGYSQPPPQQQPMMQQPMMQQPMMQQPMMQGQMQGQMQMQPGIPMPQQLAQPQDPWGSVPNNLASESVPDTDRALEIKVIWGNTLLDTVTATDQPQITMGDERRVTGWGPMMKVIRCDIEVPSKGLPVQSFPMAVSHGPNATNYAINVLKNFEGRIERADGTIVPIEQLRQGARGVEPGDVPGAIRYNLRAAETLYLVHGNIFLQIRYVRKARLVVLPFLQSLNYTWVNVLILAFFLHIMAIVSFIATPQTETELAEDIFKNANRFAQFKLTPEQKQKMKSSTLLSKLKEGEPGAKHKGAEGKAGRKDYKGKKQGRMAVKGDPDKKEIAKSTLSKLFGAKGNTRASYLFGSGGLGGELNSALGGVTGAHIGDAAGLGGLGTRGTGPGGGGLSMNSVGLGALGTRGRGGGHGGYGTGVGGLGRKADRDINISAGSPIIMGSLDKEIIRRVIKQHIAQIRYCYEKELVRSPGLFGKVATKFTIAATGRVQSAGVAQSTLKNKEVERCITSKIRTWKFPKPKGGGIVIVKYPFIFKTAG